MKLIVSTKTAYKFSQSQFMEHVEIAIGKYLGIQEFVPEEMPNHKEVRPGRLEKTRQPTQGEFESLRGYQQDSYSI